MMAAAATQERHRTGGARLHVVMVSDAETAGGAAVAASRLAEGLCQAGHRVTRVVAVADGQAHPWETIDVQMRPPLPLRVLRKLGWWQDDASRKREPLRRRLRTLLDELRPDVINLHNLHSAAGDSWDFDLVRLCSSFAPVFWTLHDMWSFTGRCAYAYDCRQFIQGCGAICPTSQEYPALEPSLIRPAWEERQATYRDLAGNVTIVTPSQWLGREAQAGMWREHPVHVVPYGLPLDVYRPLDRDEARRHLRLDARGPVLLLAAQHLGDRRKGGDIIRQVLENVSFRPLTLLTLGEGTIEPTDSGMHVHRLGYVKDEARKRLAYNAADLLLHPAPVDNLPNVVLEALACGTPTLAFPTGGLPDMVRPGQTGWLAVDGDPSSLVAALDQALVQLCDGHTLRRECRAVAEADYPLALQARRYEELLRSAVSAGGRGAG